MAHLIVKDLLSLGTSDGHSASNWEVCINNDWSNLLFQSLNDTENLYDIHAHLKNGDGTTYKGDDVITARFQPIIGDTPQPWYYFDPCKQTTLETYSTENLEQYANDVENTFTV